MLSRSAKQLVAYLGMYVESTHVICSHFLIFYQIARTVLETNMTAFKRKKAEAHEAAIVWLG